MLLLNLNLLIDAITLGSIYALIALGFHLVHRAAGVIDFAQGDKVVVGGLIALSLADHRQPLWLIFPEVVLAGLALGVLYEAVVIAPSRRRSTFAAVVATIGAALVLSSGHVIVWGSEGKPFPAAISGQVTVGSISVQGQSILIWVLVALTVVALIVFLERSRVGRGMVAAAADAQAAEALGINARRGRVLAFALAFALAGLAGLLVAPITLAGGTGGAALTLKGFTGAILGGLDSTVGVVAGAFLFGLLENVIGGHLPYVYRDPLDFSLLIVVLLLFPAGLFGIRRRRAF